MPGQQNGTPEVLLKMHSDTVAVACCSLFHGPGVTGHECEPQIDWLLLGRQKALFPKV